MDPEIIKSIAQEVAVPESSVAAVLALFEHGATAPFVARYRVEVTGGMDESKIRSIHERMTYYRDIEERGASLIKLLQEQNKLTDQIRRQIAGCRDKIEMEDLFHRFRTKRKSRAAEAIQKGLEPLAEYLWHQEPDAWSLEEHIDVFIDPDKNLTSREQVLQGALDIIIEWIADNTDWRKKLRELLWKEGSLVSTVVPAKAKLKTKYNMYYDRREAVSSVPSHRVLAIRRGTKEGVLTSSIQGDNAKALQHLLSSVIRDPESIFAPFLEMAARESYNRILRPLIETEVRARLKERADREAIHVFQENLENLLLSPPCGRIPVIGVDPGKGEDCKLAVVDQDGKFLEEAVISPRAPKNDIEGSRTVLLDLINKHNVQAVALGTGAVAREVEGIIRDILEEAGLGSVLVTSVNDAGVLIYASSRTGREELSELSTVTRSAVSTARRLQDPLAELVKIDPKLIGVGQYQHDVDQKELHRRLVQTVTFCVSRVGVDVNTAGFPLLRYVAGLNDRLARRIVGLRSAEGPLGSRTALTSVPGMDELAFQQSAGFLRINKAENPLDATAIHPESYPIVEKMAAALNVTVADLTANHDLIATLKPEDFITETAGLPTLELILDQLRHPGRDPRGAYTPPKIRTDIRSIDDLKEGMTLEGTVTNVTNFGAFVDIGIQQDGLVHLSQMSNRFIRDPREAVKVGDLVQVKVISVEVETKRIGLSMKALLPALPRRRKKPRRRGTKPEAGANQAQAAPPQPPAEAQLSLQAASDSSVPTTAAENPGGPYNSSNPERPQNLHPRERRRTNSRPKRSNSQEPQALEEPPQPEQTLQEKIAILQSKFRGIS